MVSEEIQQLRTTLDGLIREQADRRALRERQGEEIKARAHAYMTEQVQAAERYVQLRRELGRRERESDEQDAELDTFAEPEEFAEEGAPDAAPPPSALAATPPPPSAAPATPPAPPAPVPVPESARPARTPRRRAVQEVEDDDDDFLNNRWRED